MIATRDEGFDDLGCLRKKVCQLTSDNGDLGEIIGSLKSQRAVIHIQLQLAVHSIEKTRNQLKKLGIKPDADLDGLVDNARDALTQINICE